MKNRFIRLFTVYFLLLPGILAAQSTPLKLPAASAPLKLPAAPGALKASGGGTTPTDSTPPVVGQAVASNIGATSMTVTASCVDPESGCVSAFMDHDVDPGDPYAVTTTGIISGPIGAQTITATITNLPSGQTRFFRARAINGAGLNAVGLENNAPTLPALYHDVSISLSSCSTYNPTLRTCGSGSNRAFKALKDAVIAANTGDTILLRSGTSVENGDGQIAIWIDKQIKIQNYPGEIWTLQPSSLQYYHFSGTGTGVVIDGTNGGTAQGIKIDGINSSLGGPSDGASGIYPQGDNWTIQGVDVYNMPYSGITALRGSSGHVIRNNKVHDGRNDPLVTGGWTVGIYNPSKNTLIEHNEIYNIPYLAMPVCPSAFNASQYCDGNVIRFNTIHNTMLGIQVYQGVGIQIYGNIIYNVIGPGLRMTQYAHGPNNVLYNNTITAITEPINAAWTFFGYTNPDRSCIILEGDFASVKNNIAYGCSYDAIRDTGLINTLSQNLGGGTNVSGNASLDIVADPLFINAGGHDYHLQSTSPARNTGADLGTGYNIDFDGVKRVAPWDIGAYELP